MITRPQMHFSLKHKTPSIIVIIKWTHYCNFVRKRTRNKELLYPGSTMGSNHRAEFSSQPFSRSNGAPSRCTSLPRQRRRHGRHMVSAVQIGRVTFPVPPSAMERNGTVTAVKIIVFVLCGERQTFVTGQRITSSSYS